MNSHHSFRRNRKGIGTIFGMVFFLLIVMIVFASMIIVLNQNTGLEQTTVQAKQLDLDRYTEFQTTSITNPELGVLNNAVYLSYSVQNNGTLPVQLVRLWVEDVTTKTFANVELNQAFANVETNMSVPIQPGSSVYNFISIPFGSASDSDNFIFWFITARGNTLSTYPDVIQFNGIQSTGTFPGVNSINSSYSGNQTPLQLSLNTTQSNQLIYVVVSYDDGNTLYTPTSTPSLTWTLRGQSAATDRYSRPDGDSILKTFYAIMPSPGQITISIRSTADELSDYYCSALAFAINNVNTTMPFDGSAQTIIGQSVTPQNRVTTHYQNELIIGAFGIDAINPDITSGNGFSEIMPVQSSYGASGQPNAMPRSVWAEWAIASNPVNNIPVNCTFSTTRTWAMTLDAVRLYITAPTNPISLSPTSGPMGQKVTVSGQGFQPNSPLIVTVNGTQAPFNFITDQSGNIPSGAFFVVPRGVSPGNNIIVIADNFFNFSSTTFNVIPSSLAISPSSGSLDTSVVVSGLNFAPNSAITVNFDGNAIVTYPATLQSNSTGGFSATINTPIASAGIKQISATDSYNSPYSNFTVIPSITLTPSIGTIGSSVTINGSGFTVFQPVTIKFAASTVPTTPGSITGDNMGSFSATFNVPTAQVAGAKTVTATDSGSNAANSTFTVNPSISLNQISGNVGTIVSVSGRGFAASSTLSAKFNGVPVSLTGTTASASDGTVNGVFFTVPNAPAGNQTVTLIDASSYSGSAGFRVTSAVTLSSTIVSAGSSDTVTGAGFTASSIVTINYGGTSLAYATASSSGSFSLTFIVQPGLIGAHNVTVSDGVNIAYATYNLTQSVILNPSSGPAGSFVAVSGFGFTPSSTINITFAGTTIATTPNNITTDNQGTFNATFTIPTGTIAGAKNIQAIDSSLRSASANFVVFPTITLSPSSGSVGTTVTVSGTGYSGQSFITLKFAGFNQSIGSVKTSILGAFTCTFVVPAAVADLNTVTATDASSNTGAAAFLVIPTITLTPTSGNIGSTATVSGTGFSGSQNLTATFNGIPVTLSGNSSTSSSGSFTGANFTVPVAPSGTQTVIIRDSSLYFDDANFTISQVVQPITVTMSNSAPSATLTINSSYASPTTFAADGSPHSITMPAGLPFTLAFTNVGTTRNGFAVSGSFSSVSSLYTGSTTPISAATYQQVQNTHSVTMSYGNPAGGDTLSLTGTYLGQASTILTLNVGGVSTASSLAWSDYNTAVTFSASTTLSNSTQRWAINGAYSTGVLTTGGNTYSRTYYHQCLQTLSYSINGGGTGYSAPIFTANTFGVSAPQTLTTSATGYWFDASSWSVTNPLGGSSSSQQWQTSQTTSGTISSSATTAFAYYHQYLQTLSYSVSGGSPSAPSATGTSLGVAYVPSLTTTATGYWFDASGSITFSTSVGGTGERWTPVPASISATLSQTQVVSMSHQWLVTFSQSGLSSDATGTVATIAGATKVYSDLPFSVWVDASSGSVTYSYTATVTSSTTGKQYVKTSTDSSPVTGLSGPLTVTGTYKTQYQVTFTQSGLSSDATGTVATIAGATKVYSDLPFSVWVDASSGSVTYSYTATVTSSTTGKQYVKTSTDSSPVTGLSGPLTVTGTYKTQYQVTFTQSGLSSDATGTVATIAGATKVYSDLPFSVWVDASSGSVTYSYTATVTSSTTGKQYVKTSTDSSPVTGLSGPLTVTGTYKTQWQVTFAQSGLDSSATGTVLTVGSTTYTYSQLPQTNFWVDSGTSYSYSPSVQAGAGKTFGYTSVTGLSSPITATGMVTGKYGSLILRPNAAGTTTGLTPSTVPNYACVDETSSDGDTTYVYRGSTTVAYDTYNIPDTTLTGLTIQSITVHIIARENIFNGYARPEIRIGGADYSGGSYNSLAGSYTEDTYTWTTNPNTSAAWTWTNINSLEIGVQMYAQFSGYAPRCTQVWVEVTYTA